jgi:TRAP transporter TAXI family solute receptor
MRSFICAAIIVMSANSIIAAGTDGVSGPVKLPRTMAWSAYNLGTTGYSQAVAIGKVLKDEYGTTLRVIPGKNDISRLVPLRKGRVQFSANGIATYLAQEGVFQFAQPAWGPLPLRLLMSSSGMSNQALAVTRESGITKFEELRGKRIPWVRGAPALNLATEAMLACGGLGWEDVERVDFPGYNAMWDGIINGFSDAAYASTVSGPATKLEASPGGIHWMRVPHDNEACWQRLLKVAPYFTKHIATRGAGISTKQPHEGATHPYPLLTTMADQNADLVYAMTRAIHENYSAFKDADPGAIGWALKFQIFDWKVPFHDAAVQYWQDIGAWNASFEAHNNKLIQRQAILAEAWQALKNEELSQNSSNKKEYEQRWMQVRKEHLQAAGFDAVW